MFEEVHSKKHIIQKNTKTRAVASASATTKG